MKKLLLPLVVVLVLTQAISFRVSAQGTPTLRVLDMPFFPSLPTDSAYEGQSYSFGITVANNTGQAVNSTLEVLFKVDSIEAVVYSNPATSLAGNDTIQVQVTQYFFLQNQYKPGSNIVVVWPRIMGNTLPTDTFYTNVFFVPLNSTGFPSDPRSGGMLLYPNPTSGFLTLGQPGEEVFEYVRIYDSSGRRVLTMPFPNGGVIDLHGLPAGTYVVEAVAGLKTCRSLLVRK